MHKIKERQAPTKLLPFQYLKSQLNREVITMKGYYTAYGYMGLVNGKYILFATEAEYIDYISS